MDSQLACGGCLPLSLVVSHKRPVMDVRRLQISISLLAISIIIVHLIWPSLAIDGITLTLIIIAVIPWVTPLFKSLEFPGGWKIEFKDLATAKDKADAVGLLASSAEVNAAIEYPFQIVAEDDPNLALAGLRIEIEKRLRELAQSADIPIQRTSVGRLMRLLFERGILTKQEYNVLADMIGLLNSAVHGAEVDSKATDWAMDVGPRLLKALEERIANIKK